MQGDGRRRWHYVQRQKYADEERKTWEEMKRRDGGGEDVKGKLTGDGALGRLKQTEEGRGRKRKKKRGGLQL